MIAINELTEEICCPECDSIYCDGPDPEDSSGLCYNAKKGMAEAEVADFVRRNNETAESLMAVFEGEK